VLHFPPGTSRWNKIEHRLFSYISINWRANPLTSYQVLIDLIAATTTTTTTTNTGLKVDARIDTSAYQTKLRPPDAEIQSRQPHQRQLPPEWSYTIHPNIPSSNMRVSPKTSRVAHPLSLSVKSCGGRSASGAVASELRGRVGCLARSQTRAVLVHLRRLA
jgi:hypothetical protein